MGDVDFHSGGNLSNSFSALTVSGRHQVDSRLIEEDNDPQRIEENDREIMQLRRHLAEYADKEAQIQNDKRVLENRIALIHKAFHQQQEDLVEATAKARAYRQEIIEENIRIEYALQVAQEERSVFISSLVPLLDEQSLHPEAIDAYSIVSNLRILFKHNRERLSIAEERLRESHYQPSVLHSSRREAPINNGSSHPEWNHTTYAPSPEPVYMGVERKTNEDVIGSHYLPSILEEESSSHPEASEDDTESVEYDDNDTNKPLPTIEGLQILGEAYPGHEIQASGYSRNGTTHCGFEWVRHLPDGSVNYIEGATQPEYTVTADDVDTYLSVEVQPLDDKQRKGELVQWFANDHKKITCHPDMVREIENILKVGHTSFKLLLWIASSETWEPAILEIKKSSFNIKLERPNNGVVVDNKYTQSTIISLPPEIPSEFSILIPSDVEIYLRADNSTDMSCSRDTIVLTMRLFVKRAVDRKLGKKKRRVLFFK